MFYKNTIDVKFSDGMILVAKWYDRWIRVSIETPDPSGNHSLVKMVDHGGYWTFSNAEMRKIHSDFLTLPFQAIEVFLANCQPKEGNLSIFEHYDQILNFIIIIFLCRWLDPGGVRRGYTNVLGHGCSSTNRRLCRL